MSLKNRAESDAKGFIPELVFVFPPKSPVAKVMATVTSNEVNLATGASGKSPVAKVIATVTSNDVNLATVDSEEKTTEESFKERRHFGLDQFEYSRERDDPGKVLIFSHESFDDEENLKYRWGNRRDVNEIIICMQRLGYNITENELFCDLTAKETLDKLDEVIEDKDGRLKNCNSLIVFFLTHGSCSEELHTKDTTIKTSDVWKKFAGCQALRKIPKMFIFQACKGHGHSTVATKASSDQDQTKEEAPHPPIQMVNFSSFKANPLGKDMLLVYATVEGNECYRNPLTGSWFIQELCKNFSGYGRRDDVLSILIRTSKCVCGNYYNCEPYTPTEIKKQMPVFVSTLTKKFYLNRNKDRDILIKMQKNLNELDQRTEEILKILKKQGSNGSHSK